jgi:hypothetical protein
MRRARSRQYVATIILRFVPLSHKRVKAAKADKGSDEAVVVESDMVRAKRSLSDADREYLDAVSKLAALERVNASAAEISAAKDMVKRTFDVKASALEHWSAVVIGAADRAARKSAVHVVPHGLCADVVERLRRPLEQWQPFETFDISKLGVGLGDPWTIDTLFLRAEGLKVLRQWEGDEPYMYVYGSPGIGKSALLQLAALRALFQGDPVVFFFAGNYTLLRLIGDETLSVEVLDRASLRKAGHPTLAETVFCFDSPTDEIGGVKNKKKVLVVHAPSGDIHYTRKSGASGFLLTPPPTDELVAVAELAGVKKAQALAHVEKYGPFLRHLGNPFNADWTLNVGVRTLVADGVDGIHRASLASCEVDDILLMLPHPERPAGVTLSFASDYIRDVVVSQIAVDQATELLRLANTTDVRGSLPDQVFENRMIDALSQKGAEITFDVHDADGIADPKVLRIAGAGVKLKSLDAESALPAGEQLRHLVLYAAPNKTCSWDALLVKDKSVAYLLHVTVATKRTVNRDSLESATELLKALGFNGEVQLVFLLPPVAFAKFELPQKIEIAIGDESKTADMSKWCVKALGAKEFWPRSTNAVANRRIVAWFH